MASYLTCFAQILHNMYSNIVCDDFVKKIKTIVFSFSKWIKYMDILRRKSVNDEKSNAKSKKYALNPKIQTLRSVFDLIQEN